MAAQKTLTEPPAKDTVPPLTVEDLDQIAEGIEEFIIGDSGAEVQAIWQPYVDQLKAHRALLVAAPDLLAALRRIGYEPFGAADATHEQVLDAITTLAREVVGGVNADR